MSTHKARSEILSWFNDNSSVVFRVEIVQVPDMVEDTLRCHDLIL